MREGHQAGGGLVMGHVKARWRADEVRNGVESRACEQCADLSEIAAHPAEHEGAEESFLDYRDCYRGQNVAGDSRRDLSEISGSTAAGSYSEREQNRDRAE